MRPPTRLIAQVAISSAGATAQQTQHEAFAKQLRRQPTARGAHRRPNGELALAVHATRQQQIGDVRARNQQQARDGGDQQAQRRPRLAVDLVGQRHDLRAQARRAPAARAPVAAATTSRLARAASSVTSGFMRPMSLSTPRSGAPSARPAVEIQTSTLRGSMPGRHHADDGGGAAADVDVATDQRLVAAVLATPQAVADEHARAGRCRSARSRRSRARAAARTPSAPKKPGEIERGLDLHGARRAR